MPSRSFRSLRQLFSSPSSHSHCIAGLSNSVYCVFVKNRRDITNSRVLWLRWVLKNVWRRLNIMNFRVQRWLRGCVCGWLCDENCWKLRLKISKMSVGRRKITFFDRKHSAQARKHKAQRSIPVSCLRSPSRLRGLPAFLWCFLTFSRTRWRSYLAYHPHIGF